MKKFEVGKIYQHVTREVVVAEFSPTFIGEDKAFGNWKNLQRAGDECETCIRHACLEAEGLPFYREKPPEPESIELFVNIYKDKNGKLTYGGVHSSQAKADVANHWDQQRRVGTAHIKFTEGDG